MILTLTELSVLAVRNGIEDGTLRIEGQLPLEIRRYLFNAIAMHATFDNPNCSKLIARPEFLDGFATFDMKSGKTLDAANIAPYREFIAGIISTFSTPLGNNITDLRMHIYYSMTLRSEGSTLPGVVQLVAKCPGLTKLVIRFKKLPSNFPATFFDEDELRSAEIFKRDRSPNLLNISDITLPWVPVMENLEKLAIFGLSGVHMLNSHSPGFQFKKLSTLRLSLCKVEKRAWFDLMRILQPTLTKLTVIESLLDWNAHANDDIALLPFGMPYLETLIIRDEGDWMFMMDELVANLIDCPRLTRLHLDMGIHTHRGRQPETMQRLIDFPATLEIDLCFNHRVIGNAMFENDSDRFRFVTPLGARITKLMIMYSVHEWTPRYTTAFSRMIDSCPNLTSFEWVPYDYIDPETDPEDPQVLAVETELQNAKEHLVRLFGDADRAAKLTKLDLDGLDGRSHRNDFDGLFLDSVVHNCSNLKELTLTNCRRMVDRHLFQLARRGAILTKFSLRNCACVIGHGVRHILFCSGSALQVFDWTAPKQYEDHEQYEEMVQQALMQHCKYVRRGFEKLSNAEATASKCCFNVGSDWCWDEVESDF